MKYLIPVVTVLLAAAGLGVFCLADNLFLGLGLTCLALVLWSVAPPVLGRLGTGGTTAEGSDPARVKQYRAQNPGATIADGIRAMRE